MNTANQQLMAIKNKKAIITKAYHDALEKLESKYQADMEILNKEEKTLLETMKDVPTNEIYTEEE